MVTVGTKYHTSEAAVRLAERYDEGVYAAVGLHPMHAAAEFLKQRFDAAEEPSLRPETSFDAAAYRTLAASRKVVAIGEIGLDYYYRPKTAARLAQFRGNQKEVFVRQLDFARELGLPVILHCRMAHDDVIEILRSRGESRGVVHCFTGNPEQARAYAAMGFYLGINGIIFKLDLDAVIRETPLERLVVETDCPYLAPPQAGASRNEPAFVAYTVDRVAELKGVASQEVARITAQNAKALFGI